MSSVDDISSDTVFGIEAMSKFAGIPERKTYHLATSGKLPGAFRMGRTWAMLKSVYVDTLRERALQSAKQAKVG